MGAGRQVVLAFGGAFLGSILGGIAGLGIGFGLAVLTVPELASGSSGGGAPVMGFVGMIGIFKLVLFSGIGGIVGTFSGAALGAGIAAALGQTRPARYKPVAGESPFAVQQPTDTESAEREPAGLDQKIAILERRQEQSGGS